jgi:2-methylcitrate dehydratase PrpD
VLDLCNKKEISQGLEGKFSVYHAAALGLVRGRAGLQEFSDDAVNDPLLKAVRERTTATADEAVTEDGVAVEVDLADRRTLAKRLEHSLGNLERPLTDRQLEEKFLGQAVLVLPQKQAERLLALCWEIDSLDDLHPLIQAATPRG